MFWDLPASSAVARIPNSLQPCCTFRLKRLSSLCFNCHRASIQSPGPTSATVSSSHPPLLLLPPLDLCHQEVATSVSFERGGSSNQEHFTSIAHNHSMDGDMWYSRRSPVWSIKTLSVFWPAWRYYPALVNNWSTPSNHISGAPSVKLWMKPLLVTRVHDLRA